MVADLRFSLVEAQERVNHLDSLYKNWEIALQGHKAKLSANVIDQRKD
jgi:hypothetical protein